MNIEMEDSTPEIAVLSPNKVNKSSCKSVEKIAILPGSTVQNKIPRPKKPSRRSRKSINLSKYYHQRYRLFTLFDKGIQLDKESWFSVVPEEIGRHIAQRCQRDLIIDAFCGAGGSAIQFALTCNHVIAIDNDRQKIELARNNAKIYEVDHRIDFLCADVLEVIQFLKADAIFLSPPWGGPEYLSSKEYSLSSIKPDIFKIFQLCQKVTNNIALFVPRNTVKEELMYLAGKGNNVEIEQNFLNGKVKTLTAYYGELLH